MRKLLLTITLLLSAAAAPAAEPKIVGADQPVPLGELVSLAVTPPDDPKTPNPVVTVKYDWSVFEWDAKKKDFVPKRVKVDLDGGICFGAGIVEKKLLVHCAVTVVTPVKDKDGKVTDIKTNTFLLSTTVTIGDGGPAGPPPTPPDVTPPDAPRPPPAPPEADPTFDGKWGPLSKLVWKAAKDIDPAARRKAKDLAAAFRKTADQIKAGALKGQKAILAAAKQADDAALGDQADSWDPVSETLADALLKLANAGQLAADADFESAFRAVADGLEKVK